MDLARAAIARNDSHQAVLSEQLEALRGGQPLREHEAVEEPTIDLSLVGALVDRHRYYEARSLARAIDPGEEPAVETISGLLDQALAPFPAEADASYGSLLQLARVGQAPAARRALQEVMLQLPEVPDWLRERYRALSVLESGEWRNLLRPVAQVTRDTVLERLRARDLRGALGAARAAGAGELAERLERLLSAIDELSRQLPDEDPKDQRTLPMEGHGMAVFQLRMGALKPAESCLRKILELEPDDEVARELLPDVIAVRRALGAEVEPMPPRAASVHWLRKNRPAPTEGWASGDEHASWADDETDENTNVLNAAHEAELLLKLGKTDQALNLYRLLAIRHPKSAAYRARIREIEALIEHNVGAVAVEVTARHDLKELIERSLPTGQRKSDMARPTTRDARPWEEDDPPTIVDD